MEGDRNWSVDHDRLLQCLWRPVAVDSARPLSHAPRHDRILHAAAVLVSNARLDDESLRSVAVYRLYGDEIAAKLDCATTPIEHKLARIRKKWEGQIAQ
jgi:hypothetical protein